MAYDDLFHNNFRLLLRFRHKLGTLNIPSRPGKKWFVNLNEKQSKDLRTIGRFIETLRRQYRKGELAVYKIDMLKHIGFEWETDTKKNHDKKWLKKFHRLVEFKEKYGHCNVPENWAKDEELAAYVTSTRQCYKRGKISGIKIKLLEKFGFEWYPDFSQRKRDAKGRYITEL